MDTLNPVARVEMIMGIVAGKWKPAIIYALVMEGPLRFVELRRRIPKVTQRMLTQQLRDLERYGIVKREHFKEIPPRVEYSVTPLGRTLHPFFKSLCDWGGEHYAALEKARRRYESKTAEDKR
ncbi:MAG TPA: helix-turn-helix domain-containing protein [Thermoanaerobaculia bacterium]|jgi:DNA-binding HxlR family transcriptional regulator